MKTKLLKIQSTSAVLVICLLMLTILTSCSINSQVVKHKDIKEKSLKIGAILPLTGPAAIWGENIRNGMILAQQELAAQGVIVEIIFEDSQAKSAIGVSAYNKLTKLDKVDVIFSAFSRVSIPLISLADSDKIPLFMTVVAAKDVAAMSDYAFRIYSNEKQYVEPHFKTSLNINNIDKHDKIAILSVEDDYGESIRQVIVDNAKKNNIEITRQEKFEPSSTDFRTQLTKIKASKPKAILFVPATPIEIVNAIQQTHELNINADLIEAAVILSSSSIRKDLGKFAEGVVTTAFAFTQKSSGKTFNQKYEQAYGNDPLFAAAFAYDGVNLVAKASQGKSLNGEKLVENILALDTMDGVTGKTIIQQNGEINPETYSVRILNGELVRN